MSARKICVKLLIVIQFVTLTFCYPLFKSKIPNGDHVTDPCQNGDVWKGVGHKNKGGKGPLNPFGEDWGNSKTWPSICRLDSDKDGRTNGEELGDPNCVWTEQNTGNLASDHITHPGICEPLHSSNCTEINKWLSCAIKEFMCNSTKSPDVKKLTLLLNDSNVPAQETTYVCMVFDIPRDRSYDVIAAKPIVGNKDIIHHMILYGCSKKDLKVKPNELVSDCFMPHKSGCTWMISAFGLWDPALDAFCLPPDVGVRIGEGGYELLMIQYHWTNFEKTSGITDTSGLEVFYTPTLRKYNSGMLLFGQLKIHIPPKQTNFTISGGCQPFCSKHRLLGPINVIESLHHMHSYGVAQKIELFRNNSKIHTVSEEKDYNYNIPKFFRYYETPVEMLPGDYIRTTCTYNTLNASHAIHMGPGTSDEMCFGFIRYYPLSNLPLEEGGCSEFGTVPLCKVHTSKPYTVDGCDVKSVLTLHGVNTSNSLLSDLIQHCHAKDECSQSCLAVQKRMKTDPCFQNDIGHYIKYLLIVWRKWDGKQILKELGKAKCVSTPNNMENGSVLHISHVTTLFMMISCVFL